MSFLHAGPVWSHPLTCPTGSSPQPQEVEGVPPLDPHGSGGTWKWRSNLSHVIQLISGRARIQIPSDSSRWVGIRPMWWIWIFWSGGGGWRGAGLKPHRASCPRGIPEGWEAGAHSRGGWPPPRPSSPCSPANSCWNKEPG